MMRDAKSGTASGRARKIANAWAVGNLVIEARKFSGLAIDTLTKDNTRILTRYSAATALLDRGYGRPAQSLDLHLSADAIHETTVRHD